MHPLTIPEAASLFNLEKGTVASWVAAGLVPTIGGGGRKGRARNLNELGALTVGVVDSLRRRGWPLKSLAPIGQLLGSMSLDSLKARLFEGRNMLVMVDGADAKLMSIREAIENQTGETMMIAAVDLLAAYTWLAARISAIRQNEVASN